MPLIVHTIHIAPFVATFGMFYILQGAAYTYPYGQSCIPSTPLNPTVCANLMFVRSTGTVAGPPGYTAVRTVQALVKAYSTSYFAGGLTAEKGGGNDPAIDGRVLIAGSIQVLGRTNAPGLGTREHGLPIRTQARRGDERRRHHGHEEQLG